MMRGGNTDATVVVGDGPLEAPPLISHTWSAIAMHDEFWAPLAPKLRPDALVLVNDATFTSTPPSSARVHRIPATEIAAELGNQLGASMVMVGAYIGITGLVGLDATIDGMRESIPPYRTQHIDANTRAIRAGFDRVEHFTAPAWEHTGIAR
jgi:Pyruvate/2-oxoacid:ferredoxin oxidoreductase gamma subunit